MRETDQNELGRLSVGSVGFTKATKDKPIPQPKRIFEFLLAVTGISLGTIALLALQSPAQLSSIPVIGSDLASFASGNVGLSVSLFGAGAAVLLLAGVTGKREYVAAPLAFSIASLALDASSLMQTEAGLAGAGSLWLPGLATAALGVAWLALAPAADAQA